MAIGTAAAIGIGLAGAGSAMGAMSNRSAARQAAQQSQRATDASLGLQRESRDMAFQRLDPFVNRGNAAGNAMNALLGLGGAEMSAGGPATANVFDGYLQANPDVMQGFTQQDRFQTPQEFAQFHYNTYGQAEGRQLPGLNPNGMTGGIAPGGVGGNPVGMSAQQAQEAAFDRFRNSTGYQFRVNEGADALNSGFAGAGLLQSGAALRELDGFRQNMASAEFGNYMGMLGNQQNIGMGAASATAGVGQNFANNASNLMMNNAGNQANAAIARAQNNPFGNVMGVLGGGLLGFGQGGGAGNNAATFAMPGMGR